MTNQLPKVYIASDARWQQTVKDTIATQPRLDELIVWSSSSPDLVIDQHGTLHCQPDWLNRLPPILFPPTPLSPNSLLGLIYARLGNYQMAQPLLAENHGLSYAYSQLLHLQYNIIPEAGPESSPEASPENLHNRAIMAHYTGSEQMNTGQLQSLYHTALNAATNAEQRAFTARQLALLLADLGQFHEAALCLDQQLATQLPKLATIELQAARCLITLQALTGPEAAAKIQQIKATVSDSLQYYIDNSRYTDAAAILYEAARAAMLTQNYSEALGYINKAIEYYQQEDLPELTAQAQWRKAHLLQTWAQQNNPQFYRNAIEAYQQALNAFTREFAPGAFAEIHHQLGIIYSDIPDEIKKKSLWASISLSSFQEALNFYNKIEYPYQFAAICSNQGLAYTRYPSALYSDNYQRALDWYREALDIFDARQFRAERADVLLNYLEASWQAGNPTDFDQQRFTDMQTKTAELLRIATSQDMLDRTIQHRSKLEELKNQHLNIATDPNR